MVVTVVVMVEDIVEEIEEEGVVTAEGHGLTSNNMDIL